MAREHRTPGGPRKKISRSLRFRLTATYALFFTLLLFSAGGVLRQNLASTLNDSIHNALDQDWAAIKGYLRIENGNPIWYVDQNDPDEASIVARLQSVYVITDASGTVLKYSDAYNNVGFDSPDFIRNTVQTQQTVWREKKDKHGVPYLVRSGPISDESRSQVYYLSIGRSLQSNRRLLQHFTWQCIGLIPLMILGGCLLGWVFAGRALTPVLEVAQTAERIGSSNLSLRIPSRGAGDELDFLIETFNQMIQRLENSFNQIRQFSTDVSHELRTPITVVRGQLEVALFTAQTAEQYREAIVNSLQDIERLAQIVRALLLLSQAETGQVVLQKENLDLYEIVREIVDQFQIPAEGSQIRLSLSGSGEDCRADVDRVQIERMLSNLLSNALKFTPAEGEITVEIRRQDDRVQLSVADTGYGIPPEHLPHIFDRFYQVRNAHPIASPEKGLGLGLSFVAWIVRAHEGTIDVESSPGKGTKFTVTLPALRPAATAPENTGVTVEAR